MANSIQSDQPASDKKWCHFSEHNSTPRLTQSHPRETTKTTIEIHTELGVKAPSAHQLARKPNLVFGSLGSSS